MIPAIENVLKKRPVFNGTCEGPYPFSPVLLDVNSCQNTQGISFLLTACRRFRILCNLSVIGIFRGVRCCSHPCLSSNASDSAGYVGVPTGVVVLTAVFFKFDIDDDMDYFLRYSGFTVSWLWIRVLSPYITVAQNFRISILPIHS